MGLFYFPDRRDDFRRYVGLSFVLHAACLTLAWYVLQERLNIIKTTGIEIAIRTMPGSRKTLSQPKPDAIAMPLAPRRKIGRIIEKRVKIDMPQLQPQASLRRTHQDEIQLAKDRSISRFIRSENVEMIDVERKEMYKPQAPNLPNARAAQAKQEYSPANLAPATDVEIEYVEVAFEAAQINLDAIEWKPALPQRTNQAVSNDRTPQPAQPGEPGKRRALKVIKPELPSNHGIQESHVEVILRVAIEQNGFVSQVDIERSSGYLELDNRALAAIRQWIYESADKRENRLVKVKYEIP